MLFEFTKRLLPKDTNLKYIIHLANKCHNSLDLICNAYITYLKYGYVIFLGFCYFSQYHIYQIYQSSISYHKIYNIKKFIFNGVSDG